MRLLLPLLVALMVPGPSWAGDALTRLMYEPLLPSTRDALVQEVCAGSVTEAELRPLFHAEQRSAALDAARIAVCLRQADLIPLMAGEFTESQLGAHHGRLEGDESSSRPQTSAAGPSCGPQGYPCGHADLA